MREKVPVLAGLVGASGSGKTYSALALATGFQRVYGGEVFVLDTESRRALHYADTFTFRHVEFNPPFSPADYLAAVEHCVRKGAKTIVIDSTSHLHEGPGGVLEMHAAEVERLKGVMGGVGAANFPAWQKPKSELRRFINAILRLGINTVMCYRAKEKLKMVTNEKGKREPEPQGWVGIASPELIYEMTFNILLHPGSGGVPVWNPTEPGEKEMVKLPGQFKSIFAQRKPLDADIGEALARWAIGGADVPKAEPTPATPQVHLVKDVTEEEKTKGGAKVIVFTIHTASGATFVTRDEKLADVAKVSKELEVPVAIGSKLTAGLQVLESISPVAEPAEKASE